MEIVKEAFVEGRETEILWDKSKAKNNQLKLDIAVENLSMMKKRDFLSPMPLHQVCAITGKVLNTFPSRIAAARYIVENILKRPEKSPFAVTGNMEMCMRAGWKAYGFYWKLATTASIDKYTKPVANAKRVWATYGAKGGVFNSMAAAAATLGISAKVIANKLKNKSKTARYIIQEYNPTPCTLTFSTTHEAATHANVARSTMLRWIKSGKAINNTTYKVDKFKGTINNPVYFLYQGNKRVGKFTTAKEVATIVGVHYTTVAKKAKANQPLGEFNQYRVKIKRS